MLQIELVVVMSLHLNLLVEVTSPHRKILVEVMSPRQTSVDPPPPCPKTQRRSGEVAPAYNPVDPLTPASQKHDMATYPVYSSTKIVKKALIPLDLGIKTHNCTPPWVDRYLLIGSAGSSALWPKMSSRL